MLELLIYLPHAVRMNINVEFVDVLTQNYLDVLVDVGMIVICPVRCLSPFLARELRLYKTCNLKFWSIVILYIDSRIVIGLNLA